MKLKTPLNVFKNVLSDIHEMQDFSYNEPPKGREEFWKNECALHPTTSTCKIYND